MVSKKYEMKSTLICILLSVIIFITITRSDTDTPQNNTLPENRSTHADKTIHSMKIGEESKACTDDIKKTEQIRQKRQNDLDDIEKTIYKIIKKLHIADTDKERVIQSLGNGFSLEKYREDTSWHGKNNYSTLAPVSGKPNSMKGELRQLFINAMMEKRYTDISKMIDNKKIEHNSTYGGKSVLSALISDNPNIGIEHIKNIVDSGTKPNLYDIKTAVEFGLPIEHIGYFIKSGAIDLSKSWYENNATYNILTYSAKKGRLDHAHFFYTSHGVSLALENDYSVIDVMPPPEPEQDHYAYLLIESFIKEGLSPYKNDSWDRVDSWIDTNRMPQYKEQRILAMHQPLSLNNIHDKNLTPEKRNEISGLLKEHEKLHVDYLSLVKKIEKCNHTTNDTESKSTIKIEHRQTQTVSDQQETTIEEYKNKYSKVHSLLSKGKYNESMEIIDDIVNSSGEKSIYSIYLNHLITSNVSTPYMQEVIEKGGQLSKESIFIMIYNKNTNAIALYNSIHPETNVRTPDGQTPLEFAKTIEASEEIINILKRLEQ